MERYKIENLIKARMQELCLNDCLTVRSRKAETIE